MHAFPRAIVALVPLMVLASCGRATEQHLIGAWRFEKDSDVGEEVDELAFRNDHTFISWLCGPELSTPQTFVSTGKWQVRGNRIEFDSNSLTSPGPLEHYSLEILRLSGDSLTVKNAKRDSVLTFRRFDLPTCVAHQASVIPSDIESNIVGVWQVHYHTHEFKYRFASDHTVEVSGLITNKFDLLWQGSWSVSGGDLLMDLKRHATGMVEETPHWKLFGFLRDCFSIKDAEGVEYVMHRSE